MVPELREGLSTASANNGFGDSAFASALKDCLEGIDRQTTPFAPHGFWQALKQRYPTFAATTPQGHPMQQDAEELYSQTTASLASVSSLTSLLRRDCALRHARLCACIALKPNQWKPYRIDDNANRL